VGGTRSQCLGSHATPFSFNALFYGAWAALLRLLRWEGDAVLESRVNGCATLVDRKEPCTDDLLLRCCHKVWLTDEWQPVSEILERSGEGEEGAFGRLLLLEGRTAPGPERAAVERDGGDPDGVRRSRGRYFTTRADTRPRVTARTAGVYWRADPEDMSILDGGDDRQRAELIAQRLRHWKSITNA